jgi:hypothetical protein
MALEVLEFVGLVGDLCTLVGWLMRLFRLIGVGILRLFDVRWRRDGSTPVGTAPDASVAIARPASPPAASTGAMFVGRTSLRGRGHRGQAVS